MVQWSEDPIPDLPGTRWTGIRTQTNWPALSRKKQQKEQRPEKSSERRRERERDVDIVGEERDMEVDSPQDTGLKAILLNLRSPLRRRTGRDRLLRHAGYELPQRAARSPPPQDCQTWIYGTYTYTYNLSFPFSRVSTNPYVLILTINMKLGFYFCCHLKLGIYCFLASPWKFECDVKYLIGRMCVTNPL